MDLLEHVTDWVRDAPLLLLVMARPDLLDGRPAWGCGRPNATSVAARAAGRGRCSRPPAPSRWAARGQSTALRRASSTSPRATPSSSRRSSRCSPMTASCRGRRPGGCRAASIAVPRRSRRCSPRGSTAWTRPSAAVIEARRSRARSSRASASPRWSGDGSGDRSPPLRGLVRKDLIRPIGADAGHVPLPPPADPRRRLRRHAEGAAGRTARALRGLAAGAARGFRRSRRAARLPRRARRAAAARARRDRGRHRALASRASAHLGAAGLRAAQRDDPSAASTLLERATALAAHDDDARGALLPPLGASLFEAGRLAEAIARPRRGDRRRAGTRSRRARAIEREFVRLESEASVGTERARARRPTRPSRCSSAEGDQAGQCRAWYLRAQAAWIAGRVGRADTAWCEAAVCARLAGDERELFRILGMRATAAVLGPTPVDEAIRAARASASSSARARWRPR